MISITKPYVSTPASRRQSGTVFSGRGNAATPEYRDRKTDLAVELCGDFTQLQRVRRVRDVELKNFDLFAEPKLASLRPLSAGDQIQLDQIHHQHFALAYRHLQQSQLSCSVESILSSYIDELVNADNKKSSRAIHPAENVYPRSKRPYIH